MQQPPSRITNETVAEHRERILAGGRKFKYPIQYARHKLVINTILISIGVILLLILVGWWQLYLAQNTSNFAYRVTQLIPLPVASIEGQSVAYSDYLMRYRSSMHFLQQQNMINLNSKDGARQVEHVKRQSLDEAIANAYTRKLANEHNVRVTSAEIDAFIKSERESQKNALSEEAFESVVLKGYYDWSMSEYREVVSDNILRKHVSFAIDSTAKKTADAIITALRKGEKFEKMVAVHSEDVATKSNGGDVGFVPRQSQDANGLLAAAIKLKKNQVSGIIQGTDGYYIVKLLDLNNTQIRYARIKIGLHEFENKLSTIKNQKKISEFISIPELAKTQTTGQ